MTTWCLVTIADDVSLHITTSMKEYIVSNLLRSRLESVKLLIQQRLNKQEQSSSIIQHYQIDFDGSMAFVGWLEKLFLLNTFYRIQVLCYHR